MFLDNKYTRTYFSILSTQHNNLEGFEVHHIIPKSLGGTDNHNNVIKVSARTHFVLHLLLTKMTEGEARSKMCWALHRMAYSGKLYARQYALARKIHQRNVSLPKTPEHLEKIAAKLRGQKRSAEARAKISEAAKNRTPRIQSDEEIAKRAASLRGKPKSEGHREKLRQAKLGKPLSEEAKAKMSATTKGRKRAPFSAEHRAAISAAAKNRALKARSSTLQRSVQDLP